MKLKKKLPRYWLGTRKPTGLGYQPNRGIGDTTFNTLKGISILPEANAIRLNQLPNALGKLSSAALYPMLMLQNMKSIPLTSSITIPTTIASSIPQISASIPSSGISFAATSDLARLAAATTGGRLTLGTAQQVGLKAVLETGKLIVTNEGTKHVLNAAGKVAAGLGTAWGLYNIGSDIVHAGDTISQGLIANSAATNTITTAGGNTYTERGGLDSQGIMDYEHLMATAKKVGLTTDAVGLGASAGGLVGSIVPGVGTVLGTGIGAGLGLLAGGIASLLGFGDNEEEVEQMMRDQEDVFAMLNRQSRATALDKDTKAEFYNRQGSANGKLPGYNIGKGVARLSGGEVVQLGPIKVEVPGKKNNKDEYIARKGTLLGEMIQNPQSIVYTNKGGVSDYIKNGGDESVALEAMKNILKNYKNGKLPGYKEGLWRNILGALPYVAPHAISLFGNNLSLLHRAENASAYAPDVYIDNPEGAKAVNELAQLRFDADPYYREALRGLNWANYNTRRNVGLGPGGRAIAEATNYANYLRGLSDITKTYNEAQNGYAEKYAAALAQLGSTNQGRRMEAAAKRHAWMQQAMGQRESWIALYRKNIDLNLLNAAADYMRYGLYKDSLAAQNKMLNLYESQTNLDWEKYKNLIQPDNTSTLTTSSTLFYPTPEMQMRRAMGYKNGKLPCHEDGLVDTRSDTTYQGYNPNPIPWNAGRGAAGQGPVTAILDIMKSVLPKQIGYPGDFLIEPFIRESKQPSWFDLFKDSYNNTVRNEKLGKSLNKSNARTNKNKKK